MCSPLDAQRVIAVGACMACFVSTADGGQTWTRRKIIDDDYHLNRISLAAPRGTLYLAGERTALLASVPPTTERRTWTPYRLAPYDGSFYGVLPLDRRTLIVPHGLRGRIFRSVDDGSASLGGCPRTADLRALLAIAALKLKSNLLVFADAPGQARALLVSRDYGQRTTVAAWPAPLTTAVAELIEAPDGAVLAVGEAGATLLPKP